MKFATQAGLPEKLKLFIQRNPHECQLLLDFLADKVYNEYNKCQKELLKAPSEVNDWNSNQLFHRGMQAGLAYAYKNLQNQSPEITPDE